MTADVVETPETKYGHVQFKRIFDDGNYGKIEASVMMPYVVSDDEALAEVNQNIAFIQAKTGVFKQLQVETEQLPDGTIFERVKAKFAGSTVEPRQGGRSTSQSSGGSQRSAPSAPAAGGKTQIKVFSRISFDPPQFDANGEVKQPNPPWLEAAALAAGVRELWDERGRLPQFGGSGKPNGPWFKEKVDRDASDEVKRNVKAFWPPNDSPNHPQGDTPIPNTPDDEEPF